MKRPEGFDPVQPPGRPAGRSTAKRATPQPKTPQPKTLQPKTPQPKAGKPRKLKPPEPKTKPQKPRDQKPRDQKPASRKQREKAAAGTGPRSQDSSRQARQAARQRRRYERDEVRRFTRRARSRRWAWISAVSVVGALVGTVAIAVYSPILALTTIEVTGTSSVSPEEVVNAVDGQLGTPLALVDSDRLTRELAEFTLIQSYVTETVPPGTLIIHITERKPIGSIATASGFTVVDPAGVVIEKTDVRPAGIPTIELAGADTDSGVFDSVVEVLLTLPESVLSQVDRVTAATKDDVTLVLAGAGQRVVWGSAEQSELKARVLASLMATQDPAAPVEYDVTAPLNAVIRGV